MIKGFKLSRIFYFKITSFLTQCTSTGEKSLRLHMRAVSLRTTNHKQANSIDIVQASIRGA